MTSPEDRRRFGEVLRWLRSRALLTQSQLGERANLSGSSISRYESGKRLPSQYDLVQLADALGLREEDRVRLLTAYARPERDALQQRKRVPKPKEGTDTPSNARQKLPSPAGLTEIATRALADTPSSVDLLGFEVYAKALADFIRNPNTDKPLTIGIDAPWGMGKTTLMALLRDEVGGHREAARPGRSFTTVWFDAWKYDQEESLWAALALGILSEVRRRSNLWQRARFWFGLNWRRFRPDLFVRSLVRSLAYVFGIVALTGLFLALSSRWLGTSLAVTVARLGDYIAMVGAVGGAMAVLYSMTRDFVGRVVRPFDLGVAAYVREPDYERRVGFLAEFEKDFAQLIHLATDAGKWPVVVFIDDLDRCAPPKASEIVEALSILLDAEHCVFVIGMDASAVAAAIESRYRDLEDHLDHSGELSGLTLGRRFLEKIIQIQFRIPTADKSTIDSFITTTLRASAVETLETPANEAVAEAEDLIDAERRSGKSIAEAAQAVASARPDIPGPALQEASRTALAKSFDDSQIVQRAVREAAPYLGLNPRKIKRFINILRLQALIANRRGLLETGGIRLDLLAKSVVIGMCWPDMVDGLLRGPAFLSRLRDARGALKSLRTLRLMGAGADIDQQVKAAEARLDVFLSPDPRLARLVDATALFDLLSDMSASDIEDLSCHLRLASTTASPTDRVGAQRG